MKKILFSFLIFLMMSSALFANIGKIIAAKGTIDITRGTTVIKGKTGTVIEESDQIKTGEKAKMQILFSDKTIITIGKSSEFKVNEFKFGEKTANTASFKFGKGAFRTITGKIGKMNPEKFKLSTKTATIGIRGTQILGVVGNEGDRIACTEGRIVVASITRPELPPVEVKAGQITEVPVGAAPKAPRAYKPAEIKSMADSSGGGGEKMDQNKVVKEQEAKEEKQQKEEKKDEKKEEKKQEKEQAKEDKKEDKEQAKEEKKDEKAAEDNTNKEDKATEEPKQDEQPANDEQPVAEEEQPAQDDTVTEGEAPAEEPAAERDTGDTNLVGGDTPTLTDEPVEGPDVGDVPPLEEPEIVPYDPYDPMAGGDPILPPEFVPPEVDPVIPNPDDFVPDLPPVITDTTPPNAPTIDTSGRTGSSSFTITGTAEADSIVTLIINGKEYGATADANGKWSVNISSLATGSYSISAYAQDIAGNKSGSSTSSFEVDLTLAEIPDLPMDTAALVSYTDPSTFPDDDPYVSWGAWLKDDTQGFIASNVADGWVSGDLTPASLIPTLPDASYSGDVRGVYNNSEFGSGNFNMNVKFGESNPISGTLDFQSANSGYWKGNFDSSSISGSTFSTGITTASDSGVSGISGGAQGGFYGPNADSVGGKFKMDSSSGSVKGVFVGGK